MDKDSPPGPFGERVSPRSAGTQDVEKEHMRHRVESRADLLLRPIVESFLSATAEEEPRLHKALSSLDEEGLGNLGGVLLRLDERNQGHLDAEKRLLARRILARIRKPSTKSLALLNRVLDYLDLNGNALLDGKEVQLCVEIFEVFQSAESVNETLSDRELEMLYAVLRGLDRDDDGRLSHEERRRLRDALESPAFFLAEQKATNARFREVVERRG